MMIVFGLAAVTVHTNEAVCPSITLYGLDTVETTSGLSEKDICLYFVALGFYGYIEGDDIIMLLCYEHAYMLGALILHVYD